MARDDQFNPDYAQIAPQYSSLRTGGYSVTPATNEVSVKTASVTSGSVVLYDNNAVELDRVSASTSYQDTSNVGGTTVQEARLVNASSSFVTETVTINSDTGGTGSDSTDSVTSTDLAAEAFFDAGGTSSTDGAVVSEIAGDCDAEIYIEESKDSGSNWFTVAQLEDDAGNVTFTADWHTQYNRVLIEKDVRRLFIKAVGSSDGRVSVSGDER
jgi:hypothetical protein